MILLSVLDLAQHTEDWGYERFWVAEHHNMMAIAATSAVIACLAGGAHRVWVGAGGTAGPFSAHESVLN